MKRRDKLPLLNSKALYFFLTLRPKILIGTPHSESPVESVMAYLNIPKDKLARFVELSSIDGLAYYVFLDDIVRANLSTVFPDFDIEAYWGFLAGRIRAPIVQAKTECILLGEKRGLFSNAFFI